MSKEAVSKKNVELNSPPNRIKKFFFPEKAALGIQINKNSIAYARLIKKRSTQIEKVLIFPKDEAISVDEDDLVISTLQSSKTILRTLSLQLTKKSDLREAYRFQTEPLLPYRIEDALLDMVIQKKKDKETELAVFACKKQDLSDHLDELAKNNINPEIVLPKALALKAFKSVVFPNVASLIIVDLSNEEATCVLLLDNLIAASYTQSIPSVIEDFSETLTEEEQLETHAFFREIARIFLNFETICDTAATEPEEVKFLLTGSYSNKKLFKKTLSEFLHKKELVSFEVDDESPLKTYLESACAIGGAAFLLEEKEPSCNLRQEEYQYPAPWKRWKKPLIAYFSLCCLCAFTLLIFEKINLNEKKESIVKKYQAITSMVQKTPEEVEKQFRQTETYPYSSFDPLTLSTEEIESRLVFLKELQRKEKEAFTLYPDIPRVQDLIYFLAKIENELPKDDGNSFALEKLSYSMNKYPSIQNKAEKYLVRVQIEFSTPSPTQARKFQELLFKENLFINNQLEKTWKVQNNRYTATFFLKDKTQYL